MESSPPPATQWEDLDSDEIGSVASEDLYENRPNRWTGTKSTWRDLTREERMLWRSMQQVVDRDLAVHLYDAFALKRQGLDPSTAQGLTVKLVSEGVRVSLLLLMAQSSNPRCNGR